MRRIQINIKAVQLGQITKLAQSNPRKQNSTNIGMVVTPKQHKQRNQNQNELYEKKKEFQELFLTLKRVYLYLGCKKGQNPTQNKI